MADGRETSKGAGDSQGPLSIMGEWKHPRFLRRKWHGILLFRIECALGRARSGSSLAPPGNVLVVGSPGTGKTEGLKWALGQVRHGRLDDTSRGGSVLDAPPDPVVSFLCSRGEGKTTTLEDVLEVVRGSGPMSISEKRRFKPRALQEAIIEELREEHVRLLCIDEAQLIDEKNLELLRQIPDFGDEVGHPVRLCLVGTGELQQKLVAIGQLGQRFSTITLVDPLGFQEFRKEFTGLHPLLPKVREEATDKDWRRLERLIFDRTRGNIRQIVEVVMSANEAALKKGQPLTTRHLTGAVNDLAIR